MKILPGSVARAFELSSRDDNLGRAFELFNRLNNLRAIRILDVAPPRTAVFKIAGGAGKEFQPVPMLAARACLGADLVCKFSPQKKILPFEVDNCPPRIRPRPPRIRR
jgi:hypothetical protein